MRVVVDDRTYEWDGVLDEETVVSVTFPGDVVRQMPFSRLMSLTNGAILRVFELRGALPG